ncbi:MAG: glycosyltransferase 87 family protein [Candidatus Methanoplasma sp.]|jgi:cbb3-type cytochrome oxidase subunit 3|nr:glycosyltransferase 87 family protein [Candidatus Methanoplasma sp.]
MRAAKCGQKSFIVAFLVAAVAFLAAVAVTGVRPETDNYLLFFSAGLPSSMEYPPLALVFLGLPRLFASTSGGYEVAFAAEAFVFFVMGLIYTAKLAKRFNQSQNAAMLLYTCAMLLMLEFVLDRYDIFPAVITLLSIYCYVTKRYAMAWILLSIATMTKLYPAVLMPTFLIPMLADRDWKGVTSGLILYLGVAILIFLPFLIANSDAATFFITYHWDRPLQIESLAASLIYPFVLAGVVEASGMFSYGSDNMVGPIPDAVAGAMTPAMAVLLLLLYAVMYYLFWKIKKNGCNTEDNRRAMFGAALFLALTIFMMGGKVFSGQYILWIVPLSAFFCVVFSDVCQRRVVVLLLAAFIVLMQAEFAVNAFILNGDGLAAAGMFLILAKNVVLLAVMGMAVIAIRGRMAAWNRMPDRITDRNL